MTDPVPSKDQVWSDARICDELGDYDPGLSDQHIEQILKQASALVRRLRTALHGIASCSTCERCRGAATLALGGSPAEPDAYYAALNRLMVAMGNPALQWTNPETIESALIDEAARRLTAEPKPEHGGRIMTLAECVEAEAGIPFVGMEASTAPITHQEIFSAVHHHASEIVRLTAAVPAQCSPQPPGVGQK